MIGKWLYGEKNPELNIIQISFCVAAQSVFVAIQTVWEKREDMPTLLQLYHI